MSEGKSQIVEPKDVAIGEVVTVGDFAQKLELPVTKVIAELMKNGVMATINEQIDFDTAVIIGSDLGFEVVPEKVEEKKSAPPKTRKGPQATRPPVVAVMGHVDHGKTSLLDAIRSTDVVTSEAGGITQHIGAYQIKRGDRWITFLDTPGHEAFSALRAHGARMTDVAIIVVAADDGVKPQTKEAINHAQDAGVQIVIAINKIDKESADPNRVRQELSELGLVPEDWGGKTVMVEISAKTGQNIEQLLDLVLLVVDIEELTAQAEGPADGVIVESHLVTGRGPVGTVLVRNGILRLGDYIVAGDTYAKVRNLEDFRGKKIRQASPGMPAVISGFKNVPAFGDLFEAVESERVAKDMSVAKKRQEQVRSMVRVKKIGVEELEGAITAGRVKELNAVVKADVQGSLESLMENLGRMKNEEVAANVVGSALGDVSESDISLAKTAGAIILGFNVGMSSAVRQLANREQVKVRLYSVIYELLGDVREILSQMMSPEIIENTVAKLEVLGVFKVTKSNVVCGGKVLEGKISPKLDLKVIRGNEEIGRGSVDSVQKDKQEVKEVVEGELCGLRIITDSKIEVGDQLEFITRETKARSL